MKKKSLHAFESKIFPMKKTIQGTLKIFTHKKMLQRLTIAPAQIKVVNTS